jgi:DNA-binding NtrC family response regulator
MKNPLLIADEDAELCEDYRRFFTQCGYNVETASDGLDCLGKLRAMKPAVLVLDLSLRWGGGDGVLAWLREGRAASATAVVLTATADSTPMFPDDIEPPVIKFLPKPFKLATLLECVRAAAARLRGPHQVACSELFIG